MPSVLQIQQPTGDARNYDSFARRSSEIYKLVDHEFLRNTLVVASWHRDSICTNLPRTAPVLQVLKSSVPVSHRIQFRMPSLNDKYTFRKTLVVAAVMTQKWNVHCTVLCLMLVVGRGWWVGRYSWPEQHKINHDIALHVWWWLSVKRGGWNGTVHAACTLIKFLHARDVYAAKIH